MGLGVGSEVFAEFLPLLMEERIDGLKEFLGQRVWKIGEEVREYFEGVQCEIVEADELGEVNSKIKYIFKKIKIK